MQIYDWLILFHKNIFSSFYFFIFYFSETYVLLVFFLKHFLFYWNKFQEEPNLQTHRVNMTRCWTLALLSSDETPGIHWRIVCLSQCIKCLLFSMASNLPNTMLRFYFFLVCPWALLFFTDAATTVVDCCTIWVFDFVTSLKCVKNVSIDDT